MVAAAAGRGGGGWVGGVRIDSPSPPAALSEETGRGKRLAGPHLHTVWRWGAKIDPARSGRRAPRRSASPQINKGNVCVCVWWGVKIDPARSGRRAGRAGKQLVE